MIDINVSYGAWPFQRFPFKSLKALYDHLCAGGIERALISHLGGVLYPDPDPYNLELIEAAADIPGVVPVPVINPTFPGVLQSVDSYRQAVELKAIKLYPSFHNYRITSAIMRPLLEYVSTHDIKLLLTMRIEDERMQYFALRVPGVPVDDIVTFHKAFPTLRFVCLNAYLPEARRIGSETRGVGVDTAFAEWLFTAALLRENLSPERIFLGSNTPFFYTRASTDKITRSVLSDDEKQRIVHDNAMTHFGLA